MLVFRVIIFCELEKAKLGHFVEKLPKPAKKLGDLNKYSSTILSCSVELKPSSMVLSLHYPIN